MCDFIFSSALPFMPVGCISTSTTQVTQRDWPQMRREARKYVVSVLKLEELCSFYQMLTLLFLGNVYIHPTANIDPTAVVRIIDSWIQMIYFPLLKNESIYLLCLISVGSQCVHRDRCDHWCWGQSARVHYPPRCYSTGETRQEQADQLTSLYLFSHLLPVTWRIH